MAYITYTYNNCTVRVNKPDLTEKRQKELVKATETFLKSVIKEREVRNVS